MIVANMNLHEVYDTLMEEMPKLDWKRESLHSKAIKEMERSMRFQCLYDYKIPSSNNQYIIYFYRTHLFAPVQSGYLCILYDGSKRFVIKWTDWRSPAIHVFTSHFLQRYKERFLKQPEMTANEVAVMFLSRNSEMKPMAVDERINKHIEKYGEFAGEGFLVPDGFCFKLSGKETLEGKAPVGISFFTTFMPLSEMSDTQREAIFEECMKDLDSL
ncbi:MAG: hypothetical protein IKM77_08225 [Prevotella sp.]|jgi:hypothetical protein|nr:hypothetical protein [Prevotella sp.]